MGRRNTINNEIKIRVTPFGSGCGANLTLPESKFLELKAQDKLSYRANIERGYENLWWNGARREFDQLVMTYGKENI